jgi:hypothetical protein
MEIMITGSLRRIDTEDTEEVRAVRIFQGIYSVGPSSGPSPQGAHLLRDVVQALQPRTDGTPLDAAHWTTSGSAGAGSRFRPPPQSG